MKPHLPHLHTRAAASSRKNHYLLTYLLRSPYEKQAAHQAAIWAALEYAGQCLSKGSKVTLTIESVTALRNLHAAPADEEAQPGAAAQGGAAAQTPHRDGAARPMPGDGNKRQS